jgi:hypothetical protein
VPSLHACRSTLEDPRDSAKKETQKEIEILKEKIASKVAELRRQNFQAFSGKIVEIKKGEIEIKDYRVPSSNS